MVLNTALPRGLVPSHFEKYNPNKQGGKYPASFVPLDEGDADRKVRKVKISFGKESSRGFDVFEDGNPEKVFKTLIKVHKAIVREKGLPTLIKANKALITEKKDQRKRLKEDDAEVNADAISALDEAILELKSANEGAEGDAYSLFEKLLSSDLEPKWKTVVKEQCLTDNFVGLDGVRVAERRGKTLKAMTACYIHFMALYTERDAAERNRKYLSTCVKINLAKGVSVEQGVSRILEIDQMTPYLPCLKNEEGTPASMEALNRRFTGFEMCQIVLDACPEDLSTAYYASGQSRFPVDVEELTRSLVFLETSQRESQRKLDSYLNRVLGKGAGKAPPTSKAGEGEYTIPRKPRGKNKGGRGDHNKNNSQGKDEKKSGSGGKKLCALCEKHAPHIKHTHHTADCKRFNADGSEKPWHGRQRGDGISKRKYANAIAKIEKLKEERKKLRNKKSKRKHGKKRRSRCYSSSDSSSSSESDSD